MFDINQLFVAPASHAFGPDEESRLQRFLREVERATTTPHVGAAGDLQLDDDGRVRDRYRYTSTAFKQVCALVAPGLYQAVADLSGIHRTPDRPRAEFSFEAAIKIFNLAVAQRFRTRLQGEVRLIRNNQSRLIEGVMGPKYEYLGNRDVFDLARDAVRTSPRPTGFHEAVIVGRRIMLRFVGADPLLDIGPADRPARYYAGYHVSNSEVGGEASVHVASILLRGSNNTASLGDFPGQGRLPHTGKDFFKKLNRMFASVMAVHVDAAATRRRLLALGDRPLGFDRGSAEERGHRVEYLTVLLHGRSVQRSFAKSIVLSALQYGSAAALGPQMLTQEQLSERTQLDLYHALTREARPASLAIRETAEQAANALLQGWIKPT